MQTRMGNVGGRCKQAGGAKESCALTCPHAQVACYAGVQTCRLMQLIHAYILSTVTSRIEARSDVHLKAAAREGTYLQYSINAYMTDMAY
eukprot:6214826-Pleurochrysis_carterae.AAC.1